MRSNFAKVCFQLYWCLHIKHIGARVATRSCRCLRTQTRVKISAALRMMYYRVFRVMYGRVNGCTRGTRSRARYQNVTAVSAQCCGQAAALESGVLECDTDQWSPPPPASHLRLGGCLTSDSSSEMASWVNE